MPSRVAISGALAVVLMCGTLEVARAQGIMIAPEAIFVDGRTGTAAFTVINPGSTPIDVGISTLFGYPVTDSIGRMFLNTDTTGAAIASSAAAWIEAYPQRSILAPGARRMIRVMVRAPEGTPDGEYWSRLVIASREVRQLPADSIAATTVQVHVDLELRSVIPLLYRKGVVHTALQLDDATAHIEGDSVIVRPGLTRVGNAAWVGTVKVALLNEQGRPLRTAEMPLGVYYSIMPRLSMLAHDLTPGRYAVKIDGVGRRADLSPQQLLPTTPVTKTIDLLVP